MHKSIKLQVIQILFKVCLSPQIHRIGSEIDSHPPNPHTNQPAELIDMKSSAAQQPTFVQHSEILGNNRLLLMKRKKNRLLFSNKVKGNNKLYALASEHFTDFPVFLPFCPLRSRIV